MSKTFIYIIKILSFVVAIGCSAFLILPVIGNSIFTIGMGTISNMLSDAHILLYSAVLLTISLIIILIKIIKTQEGKKVIILFGVIIAMIFVYTTSLALLSGHEKKQFDISKAKALEDKKIFLRDHCTKVSPESTVYKCDDGSIR